MAFQHHYKAHQRTFLKLAKDDDIQIQNYCNLYKCSALLKREASSLEDQDFRKLDEALSRNQFLSMFPYILNYKPIQI